MNLNQLKIGIIGGGNLGIAIAKGMVESGNFTPSQITVTRRNISHLEELKEIGITVSNQNEVAVKSSELIMLAVQPKQLEAILLEIQPYLNTEHHLLVSVITGVSIEEIKNTVGNQIRVIRAMPNTAIAIKESMTCIAGQNPRPEDLETVQAIFNTVGETLVVNEESMAAATVLGACGIAFFLRFIRAASQGGIEVGFHADEAQLIAAQTAKGAASLLLKGETHPEQEIDKVTTPRGCTIAGLNEMEHNGLSSALIKGIVTSYKKIENIK